MNKSTILHFFVAPPSLPLQVIEWESTTARRRRTLGGCTWIMLKLGMTSEWIFFTCFERFHTSMCQPHSCTWNCSFCPAFSHLSSGLHLLDSPSHPDSLLPLKIPLQCHVSFYLLVKISCWVLFWRGQLHASPLPAASLHMTSHCL